MRRMIAVACGVVKGCDAQSLSIADLIVNSLNYHGIDERSNFDGAVQSDASDEGLHLDMAIFALYWCIPLSLSFTSSAFPAAQKNRPTISFPYFTGHCAHKIDMIIEKEYKVARFLLPLKGNYSGGENESKAAQIFC